MHFFACTPFHTSRLARYSVLPLIGVISTSWMVSAAALFYITALNFEASLVEAFWCVALGIIILTPLFCILGIVLSTVKWRK